MALARTVLQLLVPSAMALDLPFSWDTLPRYTFCGNETKSYTGYPLRPSAVDYISSSGGSINIIGDHSSYRYPAEKWIVEQAQVMLKKNPKQRQWAYYAIDLVRTTYETGAYIMNHSDECLLKDINGKPVPRPVYGFDGGKGSCGVEKWLESIQTMVDGGITGIFLDGFQGCDPFFPRLPNGSFGRGCTRICGHTECTEESLQKWNEGLRDAMWRLKGILGPDGTLICNQTPGPYTCGMAKNPIKDCPCDGTNDERGGGNFDHEDFIRQVDDRGYGNYAMLTHTPHADNLNNFKNSVPHFLIAATEYQYLGSGFAYGCDDGWLSTQPDVVHAFSAPLGEPEGIASSMPGCAKHPPANASKVCVRTRRFSKGTRVWVNYTSGASCVMWADGVNVSMPGRDKSDGCSHAAAWPWPHDDESYQRVVPSNIVV